MKNVKELVERAIEECEAVGIPIGCIVSVKVNSRAKSRWGRCKKISYYSYEIEISSRLLGDDVSDKATMNTVVHEVLHTCADCMNHGALWKKYANIMNRNYGYNIKRCTSCDEKGIERTPSQEEYRFVIKCEKCGHKYYYKREGKVVKLLTRYGKNSGCACGVCGSKNLELSYVVPNVWGGLR